ncbi:MAG: hypothetical protein CMG35_05600 [Candidatus Marinimicrobia bacterium]|nr:hypothetical protein [Candidatus Neomarinimicrobiota bacterium]|tara:strand:+ start:74 stop:301 length:228 start_codon:yes stop_codon:yes gene_type:complete
MATDLKTNSEAFWLTRFFGGKDKGSCVQVTMPRENKPARSAADNFFDHISLTREEARELSIELMLFANKREEESL